MTSSSFLGIQKLKSQCKLHCHYFSINHQHLSRSSSGILTGLSFFSFILYEINWSCSYAGDETFKSFDVIFSKRKLRGQRNSTVVKFLALPEADPVGFSVLPKESSAPTRGISDYRDRQKQVHDCDPITLVSKVIRAQIYKPERNSSMS